jgi:translocation and assembly module TamB
VGPDPEDPLVVVTAGWTAGDGTRVYADFTGPLKTGKVTLRSEPSRPKDEILALILYGSADQSQGGYGGDNAEASTRAGGAAGTFATQGLTEGLDELTGLQISTKIDTSNAANPRPEVEVQIARTISLQIAFVLGTPYPNRDKTYATIGWRFAQRWSLETTFGDAGSSFADVVWQLRY